jgi:recombination DNA repair RAD52 pathway protein
MFDTNKLKRLEKELDKNLVLQRYDGLDYIAGQIAIEHANAIFGYGNWSYGVKETRRDGMFIHSIIWVKVYSDDAHKKYIMREDLGTGKIEMTKEKLDKNGQVIKEPEELQEMAYKGSITDGLKRALRTLGKQFGLGLYDEKDQMQFIVRELTDAQREQIKDHLNKMQVCKSMKELEKIGKEIAEISASLQKPQIVYLREVYKATE